MFCEANCEGKSPTSNTEVWLWKIGTRGWINVLSIENYFILLAGRHLDYRGGVLLVGLGDLCCAPPAGQHPRGGARAPGERGRGGQRSAQERRRDRRRTHARLRPEAGE